MLGWIAFGLYCLFAVMVTASLIAEARNADIDDSLRRMLYVALAITAAGWPVSFACILVIRLGRKLARNKTQ